MNGYARTKRLIQLSFTVIVLFLGSTLEVMHISSNNTGGRGDRRSRQVDVFTLHTFHFLCRKRRSCHRRAGEKGMTRAAASCHVAVSPKKQQRDVFFMPRLSILQDITSQKETFPSLRDAFVWMERSHVRDAGSCAVKSIFDSEMTLLFGRAARREDLFSDFQKPFV